MFKGTIFTILYSVVVYLLNILKVLNGPYTFLKVYEQPIAQTVITFIGISISLAILTFTLYEVKKNIKI